ncbi:MAG TPA: hypothetical protein EYM83_07740 [Nitrospirales bacterium]|nr:hypothetical protein [Nitrospirales bacterium]
MILRKLFYSTLFILGVCALLISEFSPSLLAKEVAENAHLTFAPAVPPVAEFTVDVPGNYLIVDHLIFRIDKGAVGILNVSGKENPAIYNAIK